MVDKMLNVRQVGEIAGCSTPSIYRWMRADGFPRPLKLGARAVRWYESEVQEWLATRPRATGDPG